MRKDGAYQLDWRDAAAYAPLLGADRSLFAWEWLRRDPAYRAAAAAIKARGPIAGAGPQQFGLLAFEPPDLRVPDARPMWRSDVHPFVLPVAIGRAVAGAADKISVEPLEHLASIIARDGSEHLLLSDGLRSIRLDGPSGAFSAGPACLRYSMEGLISAEPRLMTLRRLLALFRSGHFARSLHVREVRARHWIMMLRAHDAMVAGADQRRMAQQFFSSSVAEPGWRSRESSVRSQVQRLVRSARGFAAGEFRSLLR